MIVGSRNSCGGNAQPPALLKPHAPSRRRAALTQAASLGANAVQL